MNLKDIIKHEGLDGFMVGLGATSMLIVGYLNMSDAVDKGYQFKKNKYHAEDHKAYFDSINLVQDSTLYKIMTRVK